MRILRYRTIAAIYPFTSLEAEIELDNHKIVYSNFSVYDGEKAVFELGDCDRWAYIRPLDEVNFNEIENEYYELTKQEAVWIFKNLIAYWNEVLCCRWNNNPAWHVNVSTKYTNFVEKSFQNTKNILCESMEECCELAQAISKYICEYDEKSENMRIKENIAKEMAHVLICIEKVKSICDISDIDVNEWIEEKQKSDNRKRLEKIENQQRKMYVAEERVRQIDICQQDIQIEDELFFEINGDKFYINASYSMWFNVDAYFGTHTLHDDNVWINFYTNWYPDGKIEAQVSIDTSEQVINLLWELTEKEKKFFITKMQEAAKRQTGKSLEELYLTEFEVL